MLHVHRLADELLALLIKMNRSTESNKCLI